MVLEIPSASLHDQPPPVALPSDSSRAGRWVLLGLLALAFAYFLYRGPIRAWQHTIDLNTFYSATRAWLEGTNPYETANLGAILRQAGGTVTPALSVNPPQTFVLLAPWAVLPWGLAEASWTILNVVLVVACLWLAMSLAGLSAREPRGLLFLIFAVALAPFHTSIAQGQLTIAVTLLVLGVLWGQVHRRPSVSGLCLAIAISLKPQMAVLFLALLLFRAQWRPFAIAIGALAVITVIGVGRLAIAGVDWLPTIEGNLASLTRGGINDPTGPTAYLMINLQVLLHLLVPGQSATVLDVATFTVVAGLGAAFLVALRRRDDPPAQLLLFSGFAVLNLLILYNRIYAATLLILPLAWVFSPERPRRCLPEAVVVALSVTVFLVPGAAALGSVTLPAAVRPLTTSALWPWVLLHEIVALIVVAVALLVAAWRGYAGPVPVSDGDDADAHPAPAAEPRPAKA